MSDKKQEAQELIDAYLERERKEIEALGECRSDNPPEKHVMTREDRLDFKYYLITCDGMPIFGCTEADSYSGYAIAPRIFSGLLKKGKTHLRNARCYGGPNTVIQKAFIGKIEFHPNWTPKAKKELEEKFAKHGLFKPELNMDPYSLAVWLRKTEEAENER